MTRTETYVTPGDLALLDRIARVGSVARAARALGISRDRAVYRLLRLARASGGPMVEGRRGGAGQGSTALTPAGLELLTGGRVGPIALGRGSPPGPGSPIVWTGRYRAGPEPTVELSGGLRVSVAFEAAEGEPVAIALDPSAVLLVRFGGTVATSARNRWSGTVVRIGPAGPKAAYVDLRIGRRRLRAEVTEGSVRALGLRKGGRCEALVKATAIRRMPIRVIPGSPPRSGRRRPPPPGGSASR
ncbi:MAG TPA: TOBE domain-containing protein [Thermoplasmata archaeon]|nr:TOBE domain-containing protein [Thermoplasmata archaeon]HEV2429846.1 TOBE domain-containing protein [Thermoplasmata archaeon]